MNTMGFREEDRLVNNMHRAVDLMNEGQHPNEAIEKIAREAEYGVEHISRMVEGVNKSLSVATLKNASEEDRPKSFPLADADTIIRNIFTEHVQTKTAAECSVPSGDFSGLGILTTERQNKTASGANDGPELTEAYIRGARKKMERLDAFFTKADDLLNQKVASARETVMRRLEDTIERLRPLSKPQLRKVAQNVMNYYPYTAEPLFDLLRGMGRIDVPELNKTAGRCIFPQEQPYRAISDLHDAARELEQLKDEVGRMKEAAGAGATAVSSALGGAASSALGLRRMQERAEKREEPAQDIDPEIVNVLKEMEARRNLMELVLYDKDMKQYPFSKLVGAYNDAVGTVTDAYRHPNILKNLMLQRLEGGDVKDVATMKQEVELGKTLAEQTQKDDIAAHALGQDPAKKKK